MRGRLISGAVAFCVAMALAAAPTVGSAQAESDALAALAAGEYEDAIDDLERLTSRSGGSVTAHRAFVHALSVVGRYEEAEDAARAGASEHGTALAKRAR